MSVYVVGGINHDIVVTSDSHMRPGETLTGDSLNTYPGGKGANQAIAAARAGANVVMVGCIGDDAPGRDLRDYLADSGVDTSRVSIEPDAPTGTALIVVSGGENSIIVVLGANQCVAPRAVETIEFAAGDVVVAQLETPVDATKAAFHAARRAGARTLLNPSPIDAVDAELLGLVDVLVVNEHEFQQIFARPLASILGDEGESVDFDGILVVTLGADGVVTYEKGHRSRHTVRAVDVVDSTGAGDCFAGYLAAGLHEGVSLDDAVVLANLAATISVTIPGAASSLPTRDVVEATRDA